MSNKKDLSARDKVIRARTGLLITNGFFGFLAMQLKLLEAGEDIDIRTMATDGKSIIYWPPFVHGMTERETEGVVAHEVMHCCFKHFSRRGNRDPYGWNIAGDFVINLDLIESGFVLPGKPFGLNSAPLAKGEKGYLYDEQFKGMSTEDVYERLPKLYISIKGGGTAKDGIDPGGCGGVLDTPGNQGEQEIVSQTWEMAVRQAIHVAKANNIGSIPGSLRRLIGELDKPKVSWRDKTRNFIDQSMAKDISWARINRRSLSIGALMPGYVSDRLNHLVFVADDSGSIDMRLLTEFLGEVAGALDEGTADQMTVIYADTRVHHVDHFVPGDLVVPHELPDGGGGTDFRDSFRWITENVPDASCVIYLTDLQVNEFGEDPGCPVLWAVWSPDTLYDTLAANVPFGNCIQVASVYS